MTKAELIAKIAEQAAISKSSAEQSLNALLDAIQDALAADGKLSLPGFGSLVVKFRAGINLKKQIQ